MNFGAEFREVHSSYFGTSIGGPNGVYVFASGSPSPVAIPASDGVHNLNVGDPTPNSIVSFMTGISQFYERSVSYPGFGPPGWICTVLDEAAYVVRLVPGRYQSYSRLYLEPGAALRVQ